MNVVFTLIEVFGLLLIVLVGIAAFGDGSADASRNFEFKDGESVFLAIIGGTDARLLRADRVRGLRQPRRGGEAAELLYPRALFGGLADRRRALHGDHRSSRPRSCRPPSWRARRHRCSRSSRSGPLDLPPKLFAGITLFALANGALINMIMASRLVYGMSNEGVVARAFGRVLPNRKTPWVAIVFTTALALILVSTGDLSTLADTTVFLLLCVFTIVNVSVLVLRREDVEHDHFRAPSLFPVLGAIVSVFLITQTEAEIILARRHHPARRRRPLRAQRAAPAPRPERGRGLADARPAAPAAGLSGLRRAAARSGPPAPRPAAQRGSQTPSRRSPSRPARAKRKL